MRSLIRLLSERQPGLRPSEGSTRGGWFSQHGSLTWRAASSLSLAKESIWHSCQSVTWWSRSYARRPASAVRELGRGPGKSDEGGCPAGAPPPALLPLEWMLPDYSGTAGNSLLIANFASPPSVLHIGTCLSLQI